MQRAGETQVERAISVRLALSFSWPARDVGSEDRRSAMRLINAL